MITAFIAAGAINSTSTARSSAQLQQADAQTHYTLRDVIPSVCAAVHHIHKCSLDLALAFPVGRHGLHGATAAHGTAPGGRCRPSRYCATTRGTITAHARPRCIRGRGCGGRRRDVLPQPRTWRNPRRGRETPLCHKPLARRLKRCRRDVLSSRPNGLKEGAAVAQCVEGR